MNTHQNAPLWVRLAIVAASVALVGITLLLSACGNGDQPGTQPVVVDPPSPDGLWVSSEATVLIEGGELISFGQMHTAPYWSVGPISVSGNTISSDLPAALGFVPDYCLWEVCAVSGSQVFDGSFAPATLTLNGVAYLPASLAPQNIAGVWNANYLFGPQSDTYTVTISASGAIYSQDTDPGSTCVINGQITGFEVSLTYDNCTGPNNFIVNGLTGIGLGYVDSTGNLQIMVAFPEYIGAITLSR